MKFGIKIFAVCSALTMIVPVAFGATTAELQAQITALLAQITALQAQLGGAAASVTFTSNLTVGSRGDEVIALQNLLISANKTGAAALAAAGATGYFGSITKAALAGYQAAANISPAVGYFGPISRAYVNSLAVTPPVTPATPGITTATEGSYTVIAAALPVADASAKTGVNVPVYGIDVKATGSDIKIDRLDLQLSVVAGAVTYNPSSFITKISVLDGSTVLASKTIGASDINQDAANAYWTRLTGLNFIASKDTTKTLTVSIDTISAIDNARTVTLNVYGTQGIRGVDGIGLNTYSALGTTKIHIFTAGGASGLTITLNSASPLVNNVIVNGTSGVLDVPMLVIDAKATTDNAIIKTIVVRQNYGSGTANTIKIYDGSVLVGSGAASGTGGLNGLTTFSNLAISVLKDTTKTLTVKVDYPSTAGTEEVASVSVDKDEAVVYTRADGITASATIAADIQGSAQYMFRRAPVISLVSVSNVALASTATASSTLNTIITLKLIPKGGTLTAPVITDLGSFFASSGASYTTSVASTTASFSLSPASAQYADGNYPENTEVLLTINGNLLGVDRAATGNVYTRNVLDFLKWTMVGQALVHQTWGLQNFVTPYLPVKVLSF